ncbi:hypothetical protein [Streptomyces sulphureus]|uniref:hypothetical protein n=1 Tax=Streptomyces sulphureus TaxID=47758 RepID=UPI00037B7A7B|nr:hypothetical protein [Streptomyces sulphureus]
MSDSPDVEPRVDEQPVLVSIPEMPDHLEAAGLPRLTPARIRQLARTPAFPPVVYERGRLRLWMWSAVERYFRSRELNPGQRTDLERGASKSPDGTGAGG